MPSRHFGVGTASAFSQPIMASTPIKRPSKRAQLELVKEEEEEEDDPLEGTSTLEPSREHDITYDPEDSVTSVSEAADTSRAYQNHPHFYFLVLDTGISIYDTIKLCDMAVLFILQCPTKYSGLQNGKEHCL